MSALASKVLAAALSLPAPWYPPGKNPETPTAYRGRLEVIAEAISLEAQAANNWTWGAKSLAMAALVMSYNESRFALEVHDGSKTGDRGRSVCLAQIQKSGLVPETEWRDLAGTDLDATRRCYRTMMRVLSVHQHRCQVHRLAPSETTMSAVFAGYGTGRICRAPWADTRAKSWARLFAL